MHCNTSVVMPRRALGVLKNLGNWAKANTKRTILAKLKKGGKKDDKENVSVTFHSHFLYSNDTLKGPKWDNKHG